MKMFEIYKEGFFSAAHRLRHYDGKCENLHGHNWKVHVFLKAERLDESGMVIDFGVLKVKLDKILARLDHKELNQLKPFQKVNPTAENIARWIFQEMSKKIKDERIQVSKVMVWETESSCAIYASE